MAQTGRRIGWTQASHHAGAARLWQPRAEGRATMTSDCMRLPPCELASSTLVFRAKGLRPKLATARALGLASAAAAVARLWAVVGGFCVLERLGARSLSTCAKIPDLCACARTCVCVLSRGRLRGNSIQGGGLMFRAPRRGSSLPERLANGAYVIGLCLCVRVCARGMSHFRRARGIVVSCFPFHCNHVIVFSVSEYIPGC